MTCQALGVDVHGDGGSCLKRRKAGGRKSKTREKERRLCLLLHPTRLRLMLPPSFSLREPPCSQRAVSGSQPHTHGSGVAGG